MQLKVKLARLSLCHCGYNILLDNIKLGTQYIIETDTLSPTEPFTVTCGGCGCVTQAFGSVMASCHTHPDAVFSKVPSLLFDFDVKGAG